MDGPARLTPAGIAMLSLLILSIIAVLVGSSTLQAIGFVVGVIVLLVLVGEQLPRMRLGGGSAPLSPMPRLRRPQERQREDSPGE